MANKRNWWKFLKNHCWYKKWIIASISTDFKQPLIMRLNFMITDNFGSNRKFFLTCKIFPKKINLIFKDCKKWVDLEAIMLLQKLFHPVVYKEEDKAMSSPLHCGNGRNKWPNPLFVGHQWRLVVRR